MTVFILLILYSYINRIHFNIELVLSILSGPAPSLGRDGCARLRTGIWNNLWVYFFVRAMSISLPNNNSRITAVSLSTP